MKHLITSEQKAILEHTKHRAAGGLYCGGGKDMDALVTAGLMESAGRKSFVPDEYFRITLAGLKAIETQEPTQQYAKTKENASIIKEIGFTLKWEGLTFLACNAARYNSHLFTDGLTPEHDACFGFKWTGKDWSVSLYHAPGKEHHDLSLIAVKYGGGGHRGACGYRTDKLPFLK